MKSTTLRVLVLRDDRLDNKAAAVLRRGGYRVTEVQGEVEAILHMKSSTPPVLVTNVMVFPTVRVLRQLSEQRPGLLGRVVAITRSAGTLGKLVPDISVLDCDDLECSLISEVDRCYTNCLGPFGNRRSAAPISRAFAS